MRNLSLIVAGIAAVALATPAEAQRAWRDGQWVARGAADRAAPRPGASYPAPQPAASYPARSVPRAPLNPPRTDMPRADKSRPGNPGGRWGGKVGGRWEGGTRAPGGWGAYRRPVRGWTLPSYWIGGSYFVSDWSNWGLSSPPYGYQWVRYYDDAVLVDRSGKVWDSVSGVDWDRGGGYAEADAYAGGAYASAAGGGGGYGADYPDYDYDDEPYPSRPIPSQPYPGGYAPPPAYAAPAAQSPCGTPSPCSYRGGGYQGGYAQGGGYAAGGYGYYYTAPVTTTIVIQSAPVVTTTVTEEVIEERVVTYAAPRTVRRVSTKAAKPTKRLYRTPTKSCDC